MNLNEIKNSIVLLRVCYDIPSLLDVNRIKDSLETIRVLLNQNNKVIILSHWGRPNGQKVPELSLEKILPLLQSNFSEEIEFIDQYGFFSKNMNLKDIVKISNTRLFLFENTRFSADETTDNLFARDKLAQKYAQVANYFIDEAFPISHRQEVTNYEVKKALPYSYGLSFRNELIHLEKIKSDIKRPFVVLMAGAKLETKLPLISKMCEKADKVMIGGQLCFTFLKAAGSKIDLYDSVIEPGFLEQAKYLLLKYKDKIVLPVDFVYGDLDGQTLALDLGLDTLDIFKSELTKAKSIFWNGPVGYYLNEKYATGTVEIGEYVANLQDVYKVLGGGDSVAVLSEQVLNCFDFVSMGGGATLEYLSS